MSSTGPLRTRTEQPAASAESGRQSSRTVWRFTLAGAAFGFTFPIVATLLAMALNRLGVSVESVWAIHRTQPLLWIIDLAPVVLGVVGAMLGRREHKLEHAHRSLRVLSDQLQSQTVEAERRLSERTEQLQARAEVSRAAVSILDPDRLMYQIVNLISDRLGYYYAAVFTPDQEGKYAVLREATGDAGRKLLESGHKLEIGGESMVGAAMATRKARIALDVGEERVRFANPLLPNTRSEIALPLIAGDRVLGALDAQSTREAAFDQFSAALMQGMADQIAIALNNAALYTESQQNVRMLNGLLEMTRDLASARTLHDLTRRAREHLESMLGVDTYYLALVDEAQTEIRFVLQRRSDIGVQEEIVSQPFGTGPGLAEHVLRTRRPLRVNASEAPARLAQLGTGTSPLKPRAYLGVPIIAGARVLGVLGMQDFRLDASFNEYHEKLAMAMADQLGVVLENLRLTEQTQRALADLDAANRLLTGQAWQRHQEEGQVLAGEWRSGQWVPADSRWQEEPIELPGQLRIPLRVRGESIGEFEVLPGRDQSGWTQDDIAFAQSLVDQVGQTLETARLLEETERLAARERVINEINSRVRQTVNLDSILQTAVSELGRSFGAARVFARIGSSEAPVDIGDTKPLGDRRGDEPRRSINAGAGVDASGGQPDAAQRGRAGQEHAA